jgi:hypothetical protein
MSSPSVIADFVQLRSGNTVVDPQINTFCNRNLEQQQLACNIFTSYLINW